MDKKTTIKISNKAFERVKNINTSINVGQNKIIDLLILSFDSDEKLKEFVINNYGDYISKLSTPIKEVNITSNILSYCEDLKTQEDIKDFKDLIDGILEQQQENNINTNDLL